MIAVVVADAMAAFRAGVRGALEHGGPFQVLEAADRGELDAAVAAGRPQLALIDVDLPPAGGLPALMELAGGGMDVVMWGFAPSASLILEAIRAGASGFLDKNIHPAALCGALHGIARGELALSRSLTSSLVRELQTVARRQRLVARTAILSQRERDVLALVATGLGNRGIASELAISEFTVKRHVHNILEKLNRRNRMEAAALYLEAAAAERAERVSASA
jgi:DNA-binding NarL/FixJ family response regulator